MDGQALYLMTVAMEREAEQTPRRFGGSNIPAIQILLYLVVFVLQARTIWTFVRIFVQVFHRPQARAALYVYMSIECLPEVSVVWDDAACV